MAAAWESAPLVGQAPAWASAPAVEAQPVEPTGVQRIMASAPYRFATGLPRDLADAGAQALERAVPDRIRGIVNDFGNYLADLGFPVAGGGADQAVTDYARRYQEARQADAGGDDPGFDWARLAGNVAMSAPVAAAIPAGGALAARAAMGAATGAGLGVLQPVTQNTDDFWTEKAKQAGLGATFGGLAAPVAGGVARMIRPQTAPQVRQLMDAGVTPTPGQILGGMAQRTEDKLTSVPIVGDAISSARRSAIEQFNRAMYNRALSPIGQKAGDEVGFRGVAHVKRALSDAYESLLPKLKFQADDAFSGELSTVRQMASTLPESEVKRFEQILQQQVLNKLTPQGLASGATIKEIESELGKFAGGYRRSEHFDTRQLASALDEVQATIRRSLERMNPEYAGELSAINTGYANFTRIRNAAARAGSREGVVTPAQLAAASRGMDRSAGKGATATGGALMQDLSEAGRTVLGNAYPDSGTTGRALMALLAGGAVHPSIPPAMVAGSLPYLPYMRNLSAAMLTQRPEFAGPLAQGVRTLLPPAGAVVPPALFDR